MERALALAALLAAALLAAARGGVDYCGASMCSRSNAHTYCQFAPGPGPRCAGYIEDRLSSDEKSRVLARLNRRRSEAAKGALKQLPPAGNMLKLRWVEELSREAQLWADQCAPPNMPEEHDVCRDLYSISVGQCVASVVGEAPGLRAESLADTWFLQGLHYRGNVSYSTSNKRYDMDFAQMLWAHTYLVGCARSHFMSSVNGRMRTVIRLVCNMAPRGPAGALWLPAAPATACPARARRDAELPALCSYHNETSVYDVLNETTQKEQTVLNAVLEIERNESLDNPGRLDEIYLKNMAIATLSQTASTEPHPNSSQKRDIIEPIFQDEKESEITGSEVHIRNDVIAKMVRDKSTNGEAQVRKANVVGRPKSYRIDELNSEFSHKDVNYAKTRPVETTAMREPDAYVEYEFQESSEKPEEEVNASVKENEVKLPSISTINPNLTEISIERAFTATTTEVPLSSAAGADNTTLEMNVTNDALKRLLELSKKTEDNPFDPETARQLQEALERMERSLAAETHVKIRRDLQRPLERREEPKKHHYQEPSLHRRSDVKTDDPPADTTDALTSKPQMLDMMIKYLPFMKNYQKLAGSAASFGLDLYSVLVCVTFILYV